jgi:hypothetical protein
MAVTLSVELTDQEYAALAHIAVDPQDWFEGMVRLRCKNTIHEIANEKIKEMIADPAVTSIPASKEDIFAQELAAGNILSAAEMNDQQLAEMMESTLTAQDLTPDAPALDGDLGL